LSLLLWLLTAATPVQTDYPVSVIADASQCTIVLSVEAPSWESVGDLWYPVIQGLGLDTREGLPVLPSFTCYVPVPPGSLPILTCTPLEFDRTEPPGALMAGPAASGSGLDILWTPSPLPEWFPDRGYGEVRVVRLAGTAVAAVTLYPMNASDPGRCATVISATLTWDATPGYRNIDRPLLEALCLPGTVYWPESPERASSPFWGLPWARMAIGPTGMYAVSGQDLDDAGCDVCGMPSASLRIFTGPGLQFDIDSLGQEHGLQEIGVEVLDGGDGTFDEVDSLVFFGRSLERFEASPSGQLDRVSHAYATHNVYWVTWGGEGGARVDTVSSLPDGSPAYGDSMSFNLWEEHDYVWMPGRETTTGWVWSMLFENVPGYFYFSTPSPDGPGTISVALLSPDVGPHRTVLQLNGDEISDTTWSGSVQTVLTLDSLEFEPSMNLLRITTRDDPGDVYINNLRASYSRMLTFAAGRELRPEAVPGRYTFVLGGAASEHSLLDVSDPWNVVRLRGRFGGDSLTASVNVDRSSVLWLQGNTGYRSPDSISSRAPGRIIGTGMQSDVAIVAGDELMDTAIPLQLIYEQRGLSTVLVSTGEIYDEFGQGLRDPGAIRSFFRYTQDSWSDPADAMLLVGDGTYDPMMHITSRRTLIPAYIKLGIYAASGESGSNCDDYYVIAHEESDLPEAPISRIPVNSSSELAVYLAKLMEYETSAPPGQWANRILLAADDEWGSENSLNETDHTLACEMLADSVLPKSLDRVKFYLIDYPWPAGTSPDGEHPQKPEAREDFVTELSSGYANVIFFGHGSYDQIAHEKLLVTSDLQRIDNDCRLPVIIFASCDVGHFDMISANSMGEEFVLHQGSGSIASIAATRGTYSGNNTLLYADYFTSLFSPLRPAIATSLWLAKVATPSAIQTNSYNVVLGDGGIVPVFPQSTGCRLTVDGDTLRRGRLNSISIEYPLSTASFPRVTESGRTITYDCLGGLSFDYLHYGSPIYEGFVSGGRTMDIDFFVPLQADTGALSRCSAVGLAPLNTESAFHEWTDLIDDGGYVVDSVPPDVESWIDGHRGEDCPTVSGETVLRVSASDSSGINTIGGGAGRSILMSLDSQGFDLSRFFDYLPDSHTSGELEYSLPELGEGSHRIILAIWDGMGNQARDTLDFITVPETAELLSSVFVYPNPGEGDRCFSFETQAPGSISVRVFTVAGRAIWETTVSCDEGYGQVLWDGLDMDGDPPATGPYIFAVRFAGADGRSGDFTGVLAVVRGGS
jgi:hypothetical protein